MLEKDLTKLLERFRQRFHNNSELIVREFVCNSQNAALVALEGMCDPDIQKDILRVLMNTSAVGAGINLLRSLISDSDSELQRIKKTQLSFAEAVEVEDFDEAVLKIVNGDTALVIEGVQAALLIGTKKYDRRAISEPPTATVNIGPREGFIEDMRTNLNQLRRRLRTPELIFEKHIVGRLTNTNITVAYLDNVADREIVAQITKRIKAIDIDGIIDSNYLVQYLEGRPKSLFKQVGISEKPDIITAKLLEGRVAIFVDGSPMVLTLPYIFSEDAQNGEDYYRKNGYALFLRLLRTIGVLVAVLLPGIYVAFQAFHYEVIPPKLLITLINSTQNVPMTPVLETLFVLLLFETIHEASVRMPRYSGMAMSIVGALVLGDTGVKAGLLCAPSVMVTALSSIAIYMIPEQIGSLSILRLTFVVLGGSLGFYGICLGIAFVLVYLASINFYKTPYFAPFAPLILQDQKDAIFRAAVYENYSRPQSIPNSNPTRMKK